MKTRTQKFRETHPKYDKEWRDRNREKCREASRRHYQKHIKEQRERSLVKNRKSRKEKPEVWRGYEKKYHKERYNSDIQYKLTKLIRNRLKRGIKNGSAVRDLGCTIPEAKIHIEKQFKKGMTWKNWNLKIWHIDHIKPLSEFDLTDREQFLKAVHYSNLQPLWAFDNLSKGGTNRTRLQMCKW